MTLLLYMSDVTVLCMFESVRFYVTLLLYMSDVTVLCIFEAVRLCIFFYISDVTALCILEAFQNQNSLKMAERILRQVGKLKAKEAFQVGIVSVK